MHCSPAFVVKILWLNKPHAALAASGGADEARQDELTGRSLMRYLKHKMENPMQLRQMATAIRTLAVPEAASRVADLLDR